MQFCNVINKWGTISQCLQFGQAKQIVARPELNPAVISVYGEASDENYSAPRVYYPPDRSILESQYVDVRVIMAERSTVWGPNTSVSPEQQVWIEQVTTNRTQLAPHCIYYLFLCFASIICPLKFTIILIMHFNYSEHYLLSLGLNFGLLPAFFLIMSFTNNSMILLGLYVSSIL